MTVHTVELEEPKPVHRSFRLTRPGSNVALESQVRPALVLPEREGRALLSAAQREDVSRGGSYSAGPAGVQVWSGPWEGVGGSRGESLHLGSVDWSYDTPVRHYITVYRVLVTSEGVRAGESTQSLLARVLGLAGLGVGGETLSMPAPPPRDPFRSAAMRERG
ncbi:MAG: hypothetical protein JWN87_819 [Frankiales bacterium]|nr:hypothetical protein [Frankiales bacterium]MCW2584661.1 hypothetical protein [Frankiales bacterium]